MGINVFAFCNDNCKHPTYTQEQFLAILQQAIENGTLSGIAPDAVTISKIKNLRNSDALQFWSGTEAEFNELGLTPGDYSNVIFRVANNGIIYICNDDMTLEAFKKEIKTALTPVTVSLIIAADEWGETVTLTNEAITATNTVEMLPGIGITADQLTALQSANCQDIGEQSAGSITFKVFGDVPSIDIPVRLIIGGEV